MQMQRFVDPVTKVRIHVGQVIVLAIGLAIGLLSAPQPGHAQARSGVRAVGRGPAVSAVHRAPHVGTALYPNFAPIPGGSAAVPGLGFDYDHVVAVRRPVRSGLNASRHTRGFITPIFLDYGLPFYDYADDQYDTQLQPEQPGMPLLQAAPQTDVLPSSNDDTENSGASSNAPVKDAGEFILMQRDGQIALAVAFTTSGDRLTYITREGIRRSFPLSDLDADSTRQMNEVNGTALALPN